MLALLGLTVFTFGMLTAIAAQVSELNPQNQKTLHQNTYLYANDGKTVLAVLRGSQARIVVPSSQISPLMKEAIVAIEDARYYQHGAIDSHRPRRARR